MRNDDGLAAAEWVVALGLAVLPMIMVVASIAPWLARQTMGRAISQEAARTLALADDWGAGVAKARAVGDEIARNYGLEHDEWEFVSMATDPGDVGLMRGVDVEVEVRVRIPALTIPALGSIADVWWTTSHVEHVDDFRSFP